MLMLIDLIRHFHVKSMEMAVGKRLSRMSMEIGMVIVVS